MNKRIPADSTSNNLQIEVHALLATSRQTISQNLTETYPNSYKAEELFCFLNRQHLNSKDASSTHGFLHLNEGKGLFEQIFQAERKEFKAIDSHIVNM